jgi:MGT family glycosyltransferase
MKLEFAGTPVHGHINPSLPVVAELVRRGHWVRYWAYPEFQAKIEGTGAQFGDLSRYFKADASGTNLFKLNLLLLRGNRVLLEKLLPEWQRDPPDMVLHDSMASWGRHFAHVLGVPSVCSTTTFAVNWAVLGSSRAQAAHFLRMLVGAIPEVLESTYHVVQISRQYKIPLVFSDVFINPAPLHIVYTSREMQPRGETFAEHYKFVGPSLNFPDPATPLPFDLPTDKPLVYVALGTLLNQNLEFYQTCFRALEGLPVHVLVSVGQRTRIADLGPVPANCTVQPFVPQLQVLQRASAFVSHGGINSVQEALVAGVPVVAIAQGLDQFWTAERVAALQTGVVIDRNHVTTEALRLAVQRVLSEPRYKQKSLEVGRGLTTQGGWKRAADEIEGLARARGILEVGGVR